MHHAATKCLLVTLWACPPRCLPNPRQGLTDVYAGVPSPGPDENLRACCKASLQAFGLSLQLHSLLRCPLAGRAGGIAVFPLGTGKEEERHAQP